MRDGRQLTAAAARMRMIAVISPNEALEDTVGTP